MSAITTESVEVGMVSIFQLFGSFQFVFGGLLSPVHIMLQLSIVTSMDAVKLHSLARSTILKAKVCMPTPISALLGVKMLVWGA